MNKNVTIESYTQNGCDYVSMENHFLNIIFLPALGGKMIELHNKKTGSQFLQEPQSPYHQAAFGDSFDKYDTSGFDECFPTIEESYFFKTGNNHKQETFLPDHGELWSRPWNYEINKDSLTLSIDGVNLDYNFNKEISINKNQIHISYQLSNKSDYGYRYLWSAHPLLNVEQGNQILIGEEITDVFVNGSSNESIGKYGDILSWPYLDNSTNYSCVQSKQLNHAIKIFTNRLHEGCAGIYKPDTNESILFSFNTSEIPFLGLWLCYGGWPDHNSNKHLTVGLEPTNGRPDSLQKAVARNECPYLESGATDTWSLTLSIINGKPDFQNCSNYIF